MKNTFQPAIILVRPQLGENIGAAARVMKNFGFTDLRIVAPRDGWPNPAAEAMAAGGFDVLQAASLYETTRESVADCTYVYATTARERGMEKEAIRSQELPTHLASRRNADRMSASALSSSHGERQESQVGDKHKTALLFGPERSGLENEDIALADCIVSVPVNPDYPSLNLAQTVALICYELFKSTAMQGQEAEPLVREALRPIAEVSRPEQGQAKKAELFGLFDHLEAELDRGNFWKVPEKKPHMWINIRNILTRANLSEQEIRTLRGIIRCLAER